MLEVVVNSFAYAEETVLKNISFQLKRGSHLAVLGESGCGKSTLLHIIYGLLDLDDGQILWNKQPVLSASQVLIPGAPTFKLVAQEFNVMPFISVEENIATHLNRLDTESDAARVDELLEVVDLVEFKKTKVKNLSGGQKQRVALAKALANEPELLLLDEPFSSIDSFRKNTLRRNLFAYLKQNNISCITATHDADEALAYADKMLILQDAQISLIGTPETVYNSLQTEYQFSFFGEITKLPGNLFNDELISEELLLLPHQLIFSEEKTKLKVIIKDKYFKGSHYLILAKWEDHEVFFQNLDDTFDLNQVVYLKKRSQ